MAKNWIAGAVGKNKGKFRKKAKAAGMGTAEFARSVMAPGSNASTTTKREASLAETLMGMNPYKRKGK